MPSRTPRRSAGRTGAPLTGLTVVGTGSSCRAAGWLACLLGALLPWAWFALRDTGAVFDQVATVLPVPVASVSVAALVAAGRRRRLPLAAVGLSWAAVGAVTVVGPWLPVESPEPVDAVRLVVANLRHDNRRLSQATADLLVERGDVVVVVESPRRLPARLREAYPFHALAFPLAVVSRYPVHALPSRPEVPAGRFELLTPVGRVLLLVVHLPRPSLAHPGLLEDRLAAQERQIGALLTAVGATGAPTLVVGDFNLSDRSRGYRRLGSHFRDAMRVDLAGPTYVGGPYRPLLLRIDHLFVPRDWCATGARRFDLAGSDHRGITAVVGPCPGRGRGESRGHPRVDAGDDPASGQGSSGRSPRTRVSPSAKGEGG